MDEKVKELWKNATFVFDANVLLNLYRYSENTRDGFLNLLEKIENRIWIPEQAGHEFLKNRAGVISEQMKSYGDTLAAVKKLSSSFSGERAHPFISPGAKAALDNAVDLINTELSESKDKQEELLTSDAIKDQVAKLFEGRVGKAYSKDQFSEIFKKGETRYEERTPPGYKDGGKNREPKNEAENRENFGDWIIWKQVMDHAKFSKTSIILVTDDRKEDWWVERSGKTIGPRPELIKEFNEESGQKIILYSSNSFLELSKKHLHTQISQTAINEIEAEHEARKMQVQSPGFSHDLIKNTGMKWMLNHKKSDKSLKRRSLAEQNHRSGDSAEGRTPGNREYYFMDAMDAEIGSIDKHITSLNIDIELVSREISRSIENADEVEYQSLEGQRHELLLKLEDAKRELHSSRRRYEDRLHEELRDF